MSEYPPKTFAESASQRADVSAAFDALKQQGYEIHPDSTLFSMMTQDDMPIPVFVVTAGMADAHNPADTALQCVRYTDHDQIRRISVVTDSGTVTVIHDLDHEVVSIQGSDADRWIGNAEIGTDAALTFSDRPLRLPHRGSVIVFLEPVTAGGDKPQIHVVRVLHTESAFGTAYM